MYLINRSKDCLKAHDNAIKVATDIATALKKARQQQQVIEERRTLDENGDETTTSPHGDNTPPSPGTPDASSPNANTEEKTKENEQDDGGGGKKKKKNNQNNLPQFRPVLTMVQHLCVAAPERAEGRTRLASGIAALLPVLEETDRARFVAFLAKVCVCWGGAIVTVYAHQQT